MLSSKVLECLYAPLSLSPPCSEPWEDDWGDHSSRLEPRLTVGFGQGGALEGRRRGRSEDFIPLGIIPY